MSKPFTPAQMKMLGAILVAQYAEAPLSVSDLDGRTFKTLGRYTLVKAGKVTLSEPGLCKYNDQVIETEDAEREGWA